MRFTSPPHVKGRRGRRGRLPRCPRRHLQHGQAALVQAAESCVHTGKRWPEDAHGGTGARTEAGRSPRTDVPFSPGTGTGHGSQQPRQVSQERRGAGEAGTAWAPVTSKRADPPRVRP